MKLEFQHYAILANGELAYAGVSKHAGMSAKVARRINAGWIRWATKYVAENEGEYPLAKTVRQLPINPVVEIRIHPVGDRDKCESFNLINGLDPKEKLGDR